MGVKNRKNVKHLIYKASNSFRKNLINIGLDKKNYFSAKTVILFILISFNKCFGCPKGPSNRGVLFNTQNMCFD